MVFIIRVYVNGACRYVGTPTAIGAAAAIFRLRYQLTLPFTVPLPSFPPPTSQRAELQAIILAMERALDRYMTLSHRPFLGVKIYSDSRYGIGCMNSWINNWSINHWINSHGQPVANTDLLLLARELRNMIMSVGFVEFIWIHRAWNREANEECHQLLDEMEFMGWTGH